MRPPPGCIVLATCGVLLPQAAGVELVARFPFTSESLGAEVVSGAGSTWSGIAGDASQGVLLSPGTRVTAEVNVSSTRSVALWVKASANDTLLAIPTDQWAIHITDAGLVQVTTAAAVYSARSTALDGHWHHIAVTHEAGLSANGTLAIFVDGALAAAHDEGPPAALQAAASPHSVEFAPRSGHWLADCRVYDGVLTRLEVQALSSAVPDPYAEQDPAVATDPEAEPPRVMYAGCFEFEPGHWVPLGFLGISAAQCAAACLPGFSTFGLAGDGGAPGLASCFCASGLPPPRAAVAARPHCSGAAPEFRSGPSARFALPARVFAGASPVAVAVFQAAAALLPAPGLSLCGGGGSQSAFDGVSSVRGQGPAAFRQQGGSWTHALRSTRMCALSAAGAGVLAKQTAFPAFVSLWVKRSASCPGDAAVFSWGAGYALLLHGGRFAVRLSPGEEAASRAEAPPGAWLHVALNADPASGRVDLWVNGVRVLATASAAWHPAPTADDLRFGADSSGAAPAFDGWFLDVSVRRYPLAEFAAQHTLQLSGPGEEARPGLVRRWCAGGSFRDVGPFLQDGRPAGGVALSRLPEPAPRGPPARLCVFAGGTVELPDTALNFPLTLAFWMRWNGCRSGNDTAHLLAAGGWRGKESDDVNPFISLFRTPETDPRLSAGVSSNVEGTHWPGEVCVDPVDHASHPWRHVAVTIDDDGESQVFWDGVSVAKAKLPALFAALNVSTAASPATYPAFEQRLGGRLFNGRWLGAQAALFDVQQHALRFTQEALLASLSADFPGSPARDAPPTTAAEDFAFDAGGPDAALLGHWCAGGPAVGTDASRWRRDAEPTHPAGGGRGVGFEAASRSLCRFDGSSALKLPRMAARPNPLTITAWVRDEAPIPCWASVDYTPARAAVLGWFGSDSVEASLNIQRYPEWRERDASGGVYSVRPQYIDKHRLCDRKLHHVAVSVTRDHVVTLYIDGAVVTTVESRVYDIGDTDTTGAVFSYALIGGRDIIADGATTEYPHTGLLGNVRLYGRVLSPAEVADAAGVVDAAAGKQSAGEASRGLIMDTCRGDLLDHSGWNRHLAAVDAATAYVAHDAFFGRGVCHLRGGAFAAQKAFDRQPAMTVMFWVRSADYGSCLAGSGAWFSLVNLDYSSLELRGGAEPTLREGLHGAPPRTRSVRFEVCSVNETYSVQPCQPGGLGWVSPEYHLGICMLWRQPCTDSAAEQLYVIASLRDPNAVQLDFYTDRYCYPTGWQTRNFTAACGACGEHGLRYTHLADAPCASPPGDMEVATSGFCDYSWRHVAFVIPRGRVGTHFVVDGAKERSAGAAEELPAVPGGADFLRIGHAWDADARAFAGVNYVAIADLKVVGEALDPAEIVRMAGCRVDWEWASGECGGGYTVFEGVSLEQCRVLCEHQAGCRAFSFPLPARPDGCRVHEDAAVPLCGAGGTSNSTVSYPVFRCPHGGLAARLCSELSAADSSGFAHATGGTETVAHSVGSGCSFNGVSSQLTVSDPEAAQRPFAFTVSLWMRSLLRCTATVQPGCLLSWTDLHRNAQQALVVTELGRIAWISTSGQAWQTTNTTASVCTSAASEAEVVWRHVAATMTATGVLSLYVDGTLAAWSAGRHAWTNGGELAVGSGPEVYGRATRRFHGTLRDVELYDKPLPASAITDLASRRGVLGLWCTNGTDRDASWYQRHPTQTRAVASGDGCGFDANARSALRWAHARGGLARLLPMTLAAWVLPNCTGTRPLAGWAGRHGKLAALYIRGGALAYAETAAAGAAVQAFESDGPSEVLCDGAWHHVALVISRKARIAGPPGASATKPGRVPTGAVVELFVDANRIASGGLLTHPNLHRGGFSTEFTLGSAVIPGETECAPGWWASGYKCLRVVYVESGMTHGAASQACRNESSWAAEAWTEGRLARLEGEDEVAAAVQNLGAASHWVGVVAGDGGYWSYEEGSEQAGEEVVFWPEMQAPGFAHGWCGYVVRAGDILTSPCESQLTHALCEQTRISYYHGSLRNVEITAVATRPDPLSPPVLPFATPAPPRPTTGAEPCVVHSVQSARQSTVTVVSPLAGPLELWVTGVHLESCAFTLEDASQGAVVSSGAVSVAGSTGRLETAAVRFPEEDFRAIHERAAEGEAVALALQPGSVSVAFALFPVGFLAEAGPLGTTVRWPEASFVGHWDRLTRPLLGLSRPEAAGGRGRCRDIVSTAALSEWGAAVFPASDPVGGIFELCYAAPAAAAAPAAFRAAGPGAAAVTLYGTCSGNGVFSADPPRCGCFADGLRGHWVGPACAVCADGYSGGRCDRRCSPAACSFRGLCGAKGECVCEFGFVGERCEQPLPCAMLHRAVAADGVDSLVRFRLSAGTAADDGVHFLAPPPSAASLPNATLTPDGTFQFTRDVRLSAALPNATFRAFSVWVRGYARPVVADPPDTLLCLRASFAAGPSGVCLGVADGRAVLTNADGSAQWAASGEDLAADRWQSVAGSWGDGGGVLYVNGRLVESAGAGNGSMPLCSADGCVLEVGGAAVEARDVRVYGEELDGGGAAAVWAAGYAKDAVDHCPGECPWDATVAIFPLGPDGLEFAVGNRAGRVVGPSNHTAGAAETLELAGDSFFDAASQLPIDAWAVSGWFAVPRLRVPRACLYAARPNSPPPPPPGDAYYTLEEHVSVSSSTADLSETATVLPAHAAFTVSFWTRHSSTADHVLFTRLASSAPVLSVSFVQASSEYAMSFFGVSATIPLGTSLPASIQHYLALVVTGTHWELHVDGVVRGAGAVVGYDGSLLDAARVTRLGPYAGLIRQLRVYRRVLSAGEVAALAQAVDWAPFARVSRGHSLCFDEDSRLVATVHNHRGGDARVVSDRDWADGAWHHFTCTASALGQFLYVDGMLLGVHDYVGDAVGPPAAVRFGAAALDPLAHGATYYFVGELSDFRLFARALSATDVRKTYLAGRNQPPSQPSRAVDSSRPSTVRLSGGLRVRRFPGT
ncbi:hypothetical protein DIPPA_27909 [Diplonema papillatum]|nr:hypothetical protein DIPPA_27909 [Diplonema papillatum]